MPRVLLAMLVLSMLPALHSAPIATAQRAALNEWEEATSTKSWWYYGQSTADIDAKLGSLNARIVDLEVQQTDPLRFAVALVENAGVYASGWWYYYGLDEAGVNTYLAQNNTRLIDLEAYETGDGLRFAVVMVVNTGAAAKEWWWYIGMVTSDEIVQRGASNNARAIDVELYVLGGQLRFAAVYIRNTGADQRGWWVYNNQTEQSISNQVAQKSARLIDIWRQPDGLYGVLLQGCPCPGWWWYTDLTEAQLNHIIDQNGARVIDLDSYVTNNQQLFAVALVNNEDPITTRVGELLRTRIVQLNGTYGDASAGLYLKQVGGPVLAGLYESKAFEPASTIKVLPHLYAWTRVANGQSSASTPMPVYPYGPTSCPGANTSGTEPLSTALTEMMQDSDNARTRSVIDTFGRANINAFTSSLGLTGSSINHTIGCGVEALANPNVLTLTDVAKIYEGVASGALLSGAVRDQFYASMAGKAYDFSGVWQQVQQIIEQEAPPSLTTQQKQAFGARIRVDYKGGNYTLCPTFNCSSVRQEYRSIAGSASIPFCSNSNTIEDRQFVFGMFVDNDDNFAGANSAFNDTKAELLREQLDSALALWGPCSGGNAPNPSPSPGPNPISYKRWVPLAQR